MPKKEYTSLPNGYPVCQHTDCQLSASCLHQTAYAPTMARDEYLHLINPTKCSKNEACHYYRGSNLTRYARGFTNFQKRMYPDQYRRFMSICINHWSRNPYFERRRGDRSLPPNEQEFILNTLKNLGVKENLEFDSYEDKINWYD